jgi:hypothetical protein
MSEPEKPNEADVEEYDEEPRNPFDNPYFLPILIAGFAAWCGWDGFISDTFRDSPGKLWFNRIAFLVLGAIAGWLGAKARRDSTAAPPGPE